MTCMNREIAGVDSHLSSGRLVPSEARWEAKTFSCEYCTGSKSCGLG